MGSFKLDGLHILVDYKHAYTYPRVFTNKEEANILLNSTCAGFTLVPVFINDEAKK